MQASAVSNSRTSSHKTMAQVFDTLDAPDMHTESVTQQCAMKLVHLSDGITFFGSITMNFANSRHEISVNFAIFSCSCRNCRICFFQERIHFRRQTEQLFNNDGRFVCSLSYPRTLKRTQIPGLCV